METERLIIRKYRENDLDHSISLTTDPDVMKYVDEGVLSREGAEALFRKLMDEFYPKGWDTIYAVFAKEDGRYIGHCSIRPRPAKGDEWEIGYILKKKEWGRGYASEIARKMIEFGFTELKLEMIFATIDLENESSIKVAKKAGMNLIREETDEKGSFYFFGIAADNFARA